ncbi:MAG: hypothetical protein ABSA53_14855 [Streptosporangiaceae bacterium]|jgi:hypothetical protein
MPGTRKHQENHDSHSPGINSTTRNVTPPDTSTRSTESIIKPENSSDQEEHGSNSLGIMAGPRIISYNLGEGERPGGMKVRFKIRVEKGKKAAALNAQQAQAIKELLQWARQHRTPS